MTTCYCTNVVCCTVLKENTIFSSKIRTYHKFNHFIKYLLSNILQRRENVLQNSIVYTFVLEKYLCLALFCNRVWMQSKLFLINTLCPSECFSDNFCGFGRRLYETNVLEWIILFLLPRTFWSIIVVEMWRKKWVQR